MKGKFKFIIFILIIIIIVAVIAVISLLNQDPNVNNFNEKVSLIEKNFIQKNSFNNIDRNIVIISISNMEKQASVLVGKGNSFSSAFSDAKNKASNFIKTNNYETKWLKVDIVDSISSNFQDELEDVLYSYCYRKGIIFEDSNREFVLTESELNSNDIIDYENISLNLDNLNEYLDLASYEEIKSVPNNIESFTTKSYFCDENNNTYELYNNGQSTGRRIIDNLSIDEVNNIINDSSNYLFNMIQADGKFVYGYNLINNKQLSDYNIIRHAGSVWSLIVTYDYDADGAKKQKINSSLDYLKNYLINNGNSSYVTNYEKDSIELGANALSLIAFCEYSTAFSDNQYVELAKNLGNGILSMQQSDGHFVHSLNMDLSVDSDYLSFLYDGESIFALCKLYGITKDEKYLNSAEKALQYCISNDYSSHCDHWISYAINEIVKYVDNLDYYKFGLINFARNSSTLEDNEYSYSTDLELLTQCSKLCNTISEKQLDVTIAYSFSEEILNSIIKEKAISSLDLFVYPEIAMYLKSPSKYCNTFFVRNDAFNLRIDDIQHSILAYYFLKESME